MSVLPSATFAGPSTAEALWAAAGSVGPGGGVTQLVAGTGIILDPSNGDGVVTITATGGGGGGGGVTSILSGGTGMGVSNPDGAVTLTNTGVTSLIAGAGLAVSGSTGAVTVSATAPYTTGSLNVSGNLTVTGRMLSTNVQGTRASPLVLVPISGGTNALGGTVGFIRIPYVDEYQGYSRFMADVAVSGGNFGTVITVIPTGETALRSADTYQLVNGNVNVTPQESVSPLGQVFKLRAYAVPSNPPGSQVGSFMEAYYFIIN